jgi:hypothetical protein
VVRQPIEAIEQRDQGFQKLRDLTRICFLWSAGLLALCSVIAAVTIPGQTQNTTSTSTNPGDTSSAATTDDSQSLQGPVAGTFQPGGGRPIAVSGGSHHH